MAGGKGGSVRLKARKRLRRQTAHARRRTGRLCDCEEGVLAGVGSGHTQAAPARAARVTFWRARAACSPPACSTCRSGGRRSPGPRHACCTARTARPWAPARRRPPPSRPPLRPWRRRRRGARPCAAAAAPCAPRPRAPAAAAARARRRPR
ncbi:MAG: hypothetical protein J3K34DRAFT_401645 [Monoraphidium minutum]|nr:MAG: hypothetical protein J3K34DRAFT_401645 [Monoraphidium minutum]